MVCFHINFILLRTKNYIIKPMNLCEKTGLVLEGGGFRAIYVAAVLEAMHRNQLFFPYAIGVSAGAAYGVSYVTMQNGRNLLTNSRISDKQYCGLSHWIKKGDFFHWEYVYKTIPTQIIPLDYQALAQSSTHFQVAMTNCLSAEVEYVDANTSDPDKMRDLLTATSSLPYVAKMKFINGVPYLDGGLADPVPVHHALEMGNNRVVVVLTRPKGYQKEPSKTQWLFRLIYKKYPKLIRLMETREQHYNKLIKDIESLETRGQAFIIRPKEPVSIGRLENNPQHLEKVYTKTLQMIDPTIQELKKWLANPITK